MVDNPRKHHPRSRPHHHSRIRNLSPLIHDPTHPSPHRRNHPPNPTPTLPQTPTTIQHQKTRWLGYDYRNQATGDSDIDLLIELDPDITFGLITFCHIENTLTEKFGKKIDLVIAENLKPSLKENILGDVIYL
ncbi:MAG: hypothetical protein BJG00_003780 [Limnothrix sp. CACIAM 69d]|nr:MAG: hypothetical protein BJG00_003780 [Limnothrix sp. CACIAM 69d]